ncbi:carboxypeptidase-like regulatory domain-containing protein [Marinifilum flexuosum]|uniref:Carboxypeptidase-like protein n=1 Tax=Marinifilum flexuosum TaxID=1117708 RepID=A0A419WXD9_9BACT|nr:carboxypeptidase-like regulatory domain-containing protein [Marinifilum flexuosum]RKE00121.1 carboxypeptidase-like protein [Marinifilum flexuosum]
MRVLLTLFLITFNFIANSQTILVQGIISDVNNNPITNAHVYLKSNPQIGTITNCDGVFYLSCTHKADSVLVISHIKYKSKEARISKNNSFQLQLKDNQIQEVKVSALSAESILQHFYERLKENHEIEPVRYKVFTRILSSKDSALFMIEEYYLDLYSNKSHNTLFNVIKCRIKPTNKYGEKEFKNHRLIALSKMRSDNLFKYKEDILNKRKLQNYNINLKGYTSLNNRDNYIISFSNKNNKYDKGTLFIDTETFALSSAKFRGKNINFFLKNSKWYIRNVNTDFTNIVDERSHRISLYELQESREKLPEKKLFMVEKTKAFTGDFNDSFWENFSHIPIEEKYLKQINNYK